MQSYKHFALKNKIFMRKIPITLTFKRELYKIYVTTDQ